MLQGRRDVLKNAALACAVLASVMPAQQAQALGFKKVGAATYCA